MPEVIQGVPFVFYGEVFNVYLADDRQWYIAINDVCAALGVDAGGQRQRIQRDEAISDKLFNIPMETPYRDSVRIRDVACLNLRALPYWLGTIDVMRIKDEHRRKVILFKREFAEAAWAVFRSDMIPAEILAEMDTLLPPEEQEYHEIMDQARRLKKQVDLLTGRMEDELAQVGGDIEDLAGRLGVLEEKLIGRVIINSAQAHLLEELIAAVALSMHVKTKRTKSKCFADVHQDFKQTFQVHLYSILPEDQLENAISFLAGRWMRLNPGEELPEIFRGGYQPALF